MESAPNVGRWRVSSSGVTDLAARVPIALAVLLLLGLELRAALWFAYQPAAMTSYDTLVYVGMAGDELFSDPARTAGYSILLRGLHLFSADVDVTILFQHLLGIATALLVYGSLRRLATPVWVAVVGAAAVLLSLDQIFLEHSLLTETPFTLAIAVVIYAGVRSLDEPRVLVSVFGRGVTSRHLWIVAAGVALGLSAWMRSVTVPAVPVLVLWFALAPGGPWRARIGRGALAGAAAVAMLLAYAGLQAAHNGYFGLTPSTGWAFYARTAQFADCTKFDPPAGTERLCEQTPPSARPGPDFYAWEPGSPARRLYGGQPNGNDELTEFARRAVTSQPLDYLRAVTIDSLRYFYPRLGARDYSGVGFDVIDIDRRAPGVEEEINAGIDAYYADEPLEITGLAGQLSDLQQVLRLQPWTMIVVTLLSLAALVLARGRLRAGIVLMLAISAALLIIPPATAIWSARYAVPVSGPLVGCAAVGAWLIVTRLRERRPVQAPAE